MSVYTIGFTEKSAFEFFNLLKQSSAKRLLDVRLNNTSQLAGFAKRDDLKFFLRELCGIEYIESPDLAPEAGMLKEYRNKEIDWVTYESRYVDLLVRRSVERKLDRSLLEDSCLLCSEHKPHHCHRRVAVEYLSSCWDNPLQVRHLY
jgi:uncharacterized protein (DUF488 family)